MSKVASAAAQETYLGLAITWHEWQFGLRILVEFDLYI